ncbi:MULTISPECIES: hypothetical protein [Acidilobus]|uniref:Uncharacterized protein n=1 Tax=Acidilobus saccharovorans (strain DSM 16705 / JCM 18335 / VKM B-2471 / 345-15) TaxID=666510 RepID=D9PZ73_ACIS3|nr:hypothetical protein [Acidilobus saccharovorans]ADL19860.1 hypothetical protein ASAC_1455 [Acidilobus saccharovorans 345-15]
MSQQSERAVSKETLEAYLKKRIQELEEELSALKALLDYIEDAGKASPAERPEDIKVGRRRVARLLRGEGYVRVVPEVPMALPKEVREYLSTVEAEIRAYQGREGSDEGGGVKLTIRDRPDGSVAEIKFDGLYSTLEFLKAKAALKYAMEVSYEVYRAQMKGGAEEEGEGKEEGGEEGEESNSEDNEEA